MKEKNSSAQAYIDKDHIIIKLGYDNMKNAVLILNDITNTEYPFIVEDDKEEEFAKEVCNALNSESEDGTTPIHRLFDNAFDKAFECGVGKEITLEELDIEFKKLWKRNHG